MTDQNETATDATQVIGVETPKSEPSATRRKGAGGGARAPLLASAVPSSDTLLTVAEVAELLRLTVKGVYAMVEARRIPFVRVSNRLRFLQKDIQDWLHGNRVAPLER